MTGAPLEELWRYRELFYFLVWRDIKVRYKQTVLGAAWAVIQPFFTMVVFTIFFGRLAGMPSDGVPYPIFAYSALVPWTYFSVALAFGGNSLVANTGLVSKVYFPRVALAAAPVIGGLVDFAIASTVLIAMMTYYGVAPSAELMLWPLLILPLAILTLGIGMVLAALNVRYRDVKYAIPFGIQLLLFLTPIIYPTSMVPDKYKLLLFLNPLTGIIEAFRAALLPERTIDWAALAVSSAITSVVFAFGYVYFHRTEREFADII